MTLDPSNHYKRHLNVFLPPGSLKYQVNPPSLPLTHPYNVFFCTPCRPVIRKLFWEVWFPPIPQLHSAGRTGVHVREEWALAAPGHGARLYASMGTDDGLLATTLTY